MSTRGAWGFRIDGEDKLTYNHSDSYPDGLGQGLAKDLRSLLGDLPSLKEKARAIRMVGGPGPDETDVARWKQYADTDVDDGKLTNWYVLLRNLQGQLAKTLDAGVMIESKTFILESLFCEWAYIINLDTEMFEVYKGFQKEPHNKGRYGPLVTGKEYYPCALVHEFKLDSFPEDFSANIADEP